MTTPNTTHTPGPWHVERPYGEPGTYITGPNTGIIAKLFPVDPDYYAGDKLADLDGNAQLIAAAPDLAEALLACVRDLTAVEIVDNVKRTERGLAPFPPRASLEMAEAALRKAGV